ncbi:MAG: hypothetical protein ACKN9D_05820 [Actinomycetales bacterium]
MRRRGRAPVGDPPLLIARPELAHSADVRFHRVGRVRVSFVGAGALVCGLALVATLLPTGVAHADDGTWQPSTWTGVVLGAPVPAVGLPPAAVPTPPVPYPPTVDLAPRYEGQDACDSSPKPGAQRLSDLIKATYGADQTVWIPRNCSLGGQSEHKEGRAVDWMLDVRDSAQRAKAESFLNWLLGLDATGVPYGNALRMGVMYIGWHDRMWRAYDIEKGWTELKGCFSKTMPSMDNTCHRNHIHISLSWDGAAGLTSFWDGTPIDAPQCEGVPSSGKSEEVVAAGERITIPAVRVLDTRAALGVSARCRLGAAGGSRGRTRVFVPITGVAGLPASGVTAVAVRVSALGPNAPAEVLAWTPGRSSGQVATGVSMNVDAAGELAVPVGSDGTIGLSVSRGAVDVVLEVVGYYTASAPGTAHVAAVAVAPTASLGPAAVAPTAPTTPAPTAPTVPMTPPPAEAAPPSVPSVPQGQLVAVGSIVGYESTNDGPLKPGEQRQIAVTGLPAQATSAILFVTAKDADKRGALRLGHDEKGSRLRFAAKGLTKKVMVVPVSAGAIAIRAAKRATVSMRVELLGYGVGNVAGEFLPLSGGRLFKGRLVAGQPVAVAALRTAGLPGKRRVKAVVLRIRTAQATSNGTVAVYPTGGNPPGTRSAQVVANERYASVVLAQVGDDGSLTFSSDVDTRAVATVIGYLR